MAARTPHVNGGEPHADAAASSPVYVEKELVLIR